MNWSEREEINRKLALNRYNREQAAKQAAKVAYEAERSAAIDTLTPLVRTFANELHKQEDHVASADTAAMLAAYAPAEALLLQLLREERREKGK
jgi:hypothetical protein